MILLNILTQPSLDWKVSLLKISTEKKKVDLDMMDNLDTSKKLVSTLRRFSISILIGLDCWDPQAYKNCLDFEYYKVLSGKRSNIEQTKSHYKRYKVSNIFQLRKITI